MIKKYNKSYVLLGVKMDNIKEFLENSYIGARAMDDIETQTRIARALAAYEADPEMEIFTEEFKEFYYSRL